MAILHISGFPRIGRKREFKHALDAYWSGKIPEAELIAVANAIQEDSWRIQKMHGLDWLTAGDFSYYDLMLDLTVMLGVIPERFRGLELTDIDSYFTMARGAKNTPPLSLTKWFDTNYHYLAPEIHASTGFSVNSTAFTEKIRASALHGLPVKATLIGPLTWLYLARVEKEDFDKLSILPALVEAFNNILDESKKAGATLVELYEPVLSLDLPESWIRNLKPAFEVFSKTVPVLLTTTFGSVVHIAPTLIELDIAGLHLDLVRDPGQLDRFLETYPTNRFLSLGVVDGRNVFKANLSLILDQIQPAYHKLGERLWLAPSCSLLHCPIDVLNEAHLDDSLKSWLSFSIQKLDELAILKRGLEKGKSAISQELQLSDHVAQARHETAHAKNNIVRKRVESLTVQDETRDNSFPVRKIKQQQKLGLPLLPTTTIGSFPQTDSIRRARSNFRTGRIDSAEYHEFISHEIRIAIQRQQDIGLDVLVHGEPERSDMVEFFAEALDGFLLTENGWVQSYGSRCVKPPVLYGDISRPRPITVGWAHFAQSIANRPVKGMLTGPVTLLGWSFVHENLSRDAILMQLALAVRDEVKDLEAAGIAIIQIDEPAFREGLPLRQELRKIWLDHAIRAFAIASSGVSDATQIHTHMCYSEFGEIFDAIKALDADVISIEASRSQMTLLEDIPAYPNDIGPGVYDIHSPRVPDLTEITALIERALQKIPVERLWINPDCGLKTRNWTEVESALRNMVKAARCIRSQLQNK
ncbi:MAG: 5-methyltetrahydropteroyltriglutamate--homocysteine S-methyltransferase [Pseudomonadota bacterium]|nr:5-methyltetrahydropteroyltriglutamate--homocysteine S-methyltransferase [Pseudomonadota bacterium]